MKTFLRVLETLYMSGLSIYQPVCLIASLSIPKKMGIAQIVGYIQ